MIWRAVKPGLHTSGDYTIERTNTVTNGYCGTEWHILCAGQQVGQAAYLTDAKRDADAHRQQKAKGLV